MIDFANIEKYRENNRIEAKKAMGGLPESIWETYSAFANTLGGIILLGVEETIDKTLKTINLPNPEKLVSELWNNLNNPKKVNINILSNKDITIKNIGGNNIIVVNVPKAERQYKPVYIDGNPVTGTYRRNGEGDYHCTKEEYMAMIRDASIKTQDMIVIDNMDESVFNIDSINRYRNRMHVSKPGHVWEELENIEFLLKIGAVGIGNDGKKHPTTAGLLMFGNEYNIVMEFNNYFLDYQEQSNDSNRWDNRIISSSGEWSGNIFDFYFKVYNNLIQDFKTPFKLDGNFRIDDTPIHKAIREALANCLVNADYHGRQGVVIIKKNDNIIFSNPGSFRIEIATAKSGGISDPRNATLLKMFNLIDIGERAGSGIPNIFSVWNKQGWDEPVINEIFEPDRVKLILNIKKIGDKKSAIKIGDKKSAIKNSNKNKIIEFLTNNREATTAILSEYLDLKPSRTRDYIKELINEGVIVSKGANKNKRYELK